MRIARGTRAGRRAAALLLAALLAWPSAQAHKPSDAYLTLGIEEGQVELRLDVALRDLDRELLLDADDDGQLRWGEVRTRWSDIAQRVEAAVVLRRGDAACVPDGGFTPPRLDRHSDGTYAVLAQRWRCGNAGAFSLDYRLFATTDPTHRAVVRVVDRGVTLASAVLVPGAPPRALAAPLDAERVPASGAIGFGSFFREGVDHILAGTDHALFLLALLLPAVLLRRPGAAPRGSEWQAAPSLRTALWEVTRIVTAFTVAHSITLALSSFELLTLPSRWVESAIAASIVFAAANNVRPFVQPRQLGWLTFGFGLVHGIGFAGVLADVGLQGQSLVVPLLAFNLGVEAGQLLIVSAWLALAWPLRRWAGYHRFVRWGSVLVAGVALLWLAERALLLQLLPS